MKKLHPILVLAFVVATIVVIGYAYMVFGERYGFKKTEGSKSANENRSSIIDNLGGYLTGNSNENTNTNQNGNANDNQNSNANTNANANANTNADSADLGEVTSKDCDNDCKRFKDSDKYQYCQQVCGDIPTSKKDSEADCASLTGLERDYCWRDLAVSKLDSSVCSKISDKKLQSVCRNRVAEELLN